MNKTVKDLKDISKLQSNGRRAIPVNYMGKFLQRFLEGYGRSATSDLSILMGIGRGGLQKAIQNENGMRHPNAQKLAIICGVSLDRLTDSGKYVYPLSNNKIDKEEFAKHVYEKSQHMRSREFMVDVRRNVNKYLPKNRKVTEQPKVEEQPVVGEIVEATKPVFAVPVAASGQVMNKAAVQRILKDAEQFRQANDIEWYIKEDGSLGARKTVVVEF